MNTQELKGVAPEATPVAPAVAPPVSPEGNPPQPEDGKIVFESQEAVDKAINAGRADLGRTNADLKTRLETATTQIDGLRTTQEGIRSNQRKAELALIEEPAAKAAKQAEFDTQDKEADITRRSAELDTRESKIDASATANIAITAEARARELEVSTGVPAQTLLDSPLVKDTSVDGIVTYHVDRMALVADILKGQGENKGVIAVGASTPAALAAAASDDKTFLKGWGDGTIPITAENQKRADRIHKELSTTV